MKWSIYNGFKTSKNTDFVRNISSDQEVTGQQAYSLHLYTEYFHLLSSSSFYLPYKVSSLISMIEFQVIGFYSSIFMTHCSDWILPQ